jgi:CheY-like chemotaxis protein
LGGPSVDAFHVVIVEDLEDTSTLYSRFLTHLGYHVTAIPDGLEALEQIPALLPHVIIMDIAIPGVDGLEVTRRLKRRRLTREIPVIAVSGYTSAGSPEKASKAGCVSYLPKPCLPARLAEEIQRVLVKTGPRRRRDELN